ncbi:trafficking protein particle complex II-specific subunit 130-like protein isoform X3 [Gossypium australe]|uniref:Trafficking protein particle complex II-specific subunit 130-like protein isoform X3 n=1 Tax=Gossypium australe TaxID=47621 RepID=A0A5B6VTD6_9ROSI|nr:trafficking protein particle complex II-specific subunit 130-like protein isoform X3 [Gossypium australe]
MDWAQLVRQTLVMLQTILSPAANKHFEHLCHVSGKIEFPLNGLLFVLLMISLQEGHLQIIYVMLRAVAGALAKQSIVDRMRTIALKFEFEISKNQIYDTTIALHFSDPFHVSTRVANQCNDSTLLLQVMTCLTLMYSIHKCDKLIPFNGITQPVTCSNVAFMQSMQPMQPNEPENETAKVAMHTCRMEAKIE